MELFWILSSFSSGMNNRKATQLLIWSIEVHSLISRHLNSKYISANLLLDLETYQVSLNTRVCVHIHIYIYICLFHVCVYIYVLLCVHIYIYIHMCIYIYTCNLICVYIYIYICMKK